MTTATVDSAGERRLMLKSLGQRPGREAVEQAQQGMARIDDLLNENLRNVTLAPPPSGADVTEWRKSQVIFLAIVFLPIGGLWRTANLTFWMLG